MATSTLPFLGRRRLYRLGAVMAALGLAITLSVVWQSVDPPAAARASTEPAADSECYAGDPSDSERTYLKAGIEATGTRDKADEARAVTVTARATGSAYGCGPAGRAKQAPIITVALEFRLTGERLCYPDSVDGDETCTGDRKELTVTHAFSCKKEQVCDLSWADETLRAKVDGRISTQEARSIVTNVGDILPATSSYLVVVSG
ncbi:hypothetical protein AB0368_30960 [Actinoplanes sp. NPDC051475]|uniref:hypothetical protein n=1 Tax=Actinoplanes sp. NPDC051475 TaxID=3157225 RepID=UPI003450923F